MTTLPAANRSGAVLTLEETALSLRVSSKTVWRLVKTNSLPAFRVGTNWRVREQDLNAWIDREVLKGNRVVYQPLLITNSEDAAALKEIDDLPSFDGLDRPTFIDLFAGCGGMSLGLGSAGWRGLLAVENDPMAFDTFRFNLLDRSSVFSSWPDSVPKERLDVLELLRSKSFREVARALKGKLTLLAGGPPCQGFSVAGARDGRDDRNELASAFLKFVDLLHPPFVLIENVEGMDRPFKSKPRGSSASVAQELMDALRDTLGYISFSEVLQAADFGVPQTRNRLFIFGVRKDLARGVDESQLNLFFQMHLLRRAFLRAKHLPTDRPVTVLEALGDLTSNEVVDCPDAPKFKSGLYVAPVSQYSRLMRAEKSEGVPDSHRFPNHSDEIRRRYERFQRELNWGRVARKTLLESGTGKHRVVYMDPSQPAPTLTTSPDDFLHFQQPRIITVREMARLQSFPDHFEFKGRYTINGPRRRFDRARVSQAGNAVPPFLAEAIGYGLALVLRAIRTAAQDRSEDLR